MQSRSRALLPPALFAAMMVTFGAVACGSNEDLANPGGTLPPIRTTTTLASSQTTLEPYFLHYRLKAGENLGDVARAFNVPLAILIEYNADSLPDDPSNLPIGFEIVIPPHRWIESLPTVPTTAPPG